MPIIDGVKSVAECINTGIEQGKDDELLRQFELNKAKFEMSNNEENQGVSVSYDPNLYKGIMK